MCMCMWVCVHAYKGGFNLLGNQVNKKPLPKNPWKTHYIRIALGLTWNNYKLFLHSGYFAFEMASRAQTYVLWFKPILHFNLNKTVAVENNSFPPYWIYMEVSWCLTQMFILHWFEICLELAHSYLCFH